jgi:serine/threonine protein kinase
MSETITIPGYTIESKLGQGGMATVYLAIQESFGRKVALKVMSPVLNSDPSFATRFMREARIVAVLSHASIVPVFEVGEHGTYHYLSMEYLPAGDLKSRILNDERSLTLAVDVCLALCAALDVAHRKGFVHRDIKPENILFREDGTPVLTDFGIARALDSGRALTIAGMLVGTPNYMSPEQVKGLEVDGRSDLYAVGVVFYEILTGDVPFRADSSLSVALKHVSDPLPPLPQQYSAYQEFLDRLTAKDPESRFASGVDVIRALKQIASQNPIVEATLVRPQSVRSAGPPAPPAAAAAKEPANGLRAAKSPAKGAPARKPKTEVARPRSARGKPAAPAPQGSPTRGRLGWVAAGALSAIAALAAGMSLMGGNENPRSGPEAAPPPLTQGAHPSPTLDTARVQPKQRLARAQTSRSSAPRQPPSDATPPAPPPATESASTEAQDAGAPATTPPAPVAVPEVQPAPATREIRTPGRNVQPPPAKEQKDQADDAHKHLADERRQRKAQEAKIVRQRAAQLGAQAQETEIRDLLATAKKNLAAGALWQPAGASAADRYRAVLRLQPSQPEALAGAHRLANVLVEEARHSESAGDIYMSTLLLTQIRSLQSDNPKLPELQARLQQMQAKPADLNVRAKGKLERAAAYIAKAQEDLARTPLDSRAADDATDEYDRAAAEEPLAPGLPSLKVRLIAAYAAAVQTELAHQETKRAQKLIATAHKRNWSSAELDQLEASIPQTPPPAASAQTQTKSR